MASSGSGATAATSAASEATPSQNTANVSVGLRAGGVDDNARFADHLTYLQQSASLGVTVHPHATGSMGDEIAALKSSLADISARIEGLPAEPDVRFALTIYRDRVDSFLTRTWNFSSDPTSFQQEIAGVSADGGGDYPEDVQQGLYDGLHKPDWRGPGTVKLMFLIGDGSRRGHRLRTASGRLSSPPGDRRPGCDARRCVQG